MKYIKKYPDFVFGLVVGIIGALIIKCCISFLGSITNSCSWSILNAASTTLMMIAILFTARFTHNQIQEQKIIDILLLI